LSFDCLSYFFLIFSFLRLNLVFFRTPTTSLQRLDALLFEKVQLYDCFRESFLRIRATLSVIDEDRIGCLQPSTEAASPKIISSA